MKFNEIIRSRDEIPKNLPRKDELTQDYFDRATKTQYQINGYPIYMIQPKGTSRAVLMLFVATPEQDAFLGIMAILKSPHGNGQFMFSEVYFDPSIQGKGIAIELYKLAILKFGLTIVSDTSQTAGSETLWNRLARDSEINVYAWDQQTDQFRDFDPDDPDDVYYDPKEIKRLKQEAEDINKKLQDQYLNGDIDDEEYNQLLSKYLNPIYDELESAEHAQDMRLVATKGMLK